MIYESSRDHGTGTITLLFDGDRPSLSEIDEYLSNNYGMGVCGLVEVDQPNTFRGMLNPGTVTITL